MLRWPLVSCALSLLALTALHCSSFSGTANDDARDAAVDATAGDGSTADDAGADAKSPFCRTVDATLCLDFDDGLFGATTPSQRDGTVTVTSNGYLGTPSVTSTITKGDGIASLERALPVDGGISRVHFSAQVKLPALAHANVSLFSLPPNLGPMAVEVEALLVVDTSGVAVFLGPKGKSPIQVCESVMPGGQDGWFPVVLDFDVANRNVTGTIAGRACSGAAAFFDGGSNAGSVVPTYDAALFPSASFNLGPSYFESAKTTSFTVSFDDVVLDVR